MLTCIRKSVDAGHISLEDGQAVQKKIDQIIRSGLGPQAARDQVAKELEVEMFEKKRRALLQEERRQINVKNLLAHTNFKGKIDPGDGLMRLHEHYGTARFEDMETRRLTILGSAHAKLDALLYELRKGAIKGDLRRRSGQVAARLDNIVREAFGEDTGDAAAKALAQTWADVADDLRQRFNAAGGAIGKLTKWGLPQHHDAEALLTFGKTKWVEHILPLLDRERMVSHLTNSKLSEGELRDALAVMWDRITTDGWIDREPSAQGSGKGALFRQHADHRFLHFKDADTWLAYQRDFGEGDPYAAMMGHLSVMARDIAHMEILGPNPTAMRAYLKDVIAKWAADQPKKMKDRTTGRLHRADAMWDVMRGTYNAPVNPRIANYMAGARNLVSAAALGSAQLSALSDVSTGLITRYMTGLPVMRDVADTVALFKGAERREAVRAGLMLDSALHVMEQQARYVGAINTRSRTGFLADRVIALQGLSVWTQARKHQFGMAMQAEYADRVALEFAALPGPLQRNFERHGITAADWNQIRTAKLYEPEPGATFLRPSEIEKAAGRAPAEKYLAMIMRETRYAVPEGGIRSQSILVAGRPGSFIGELSRNFAQFKSFGVAVVLLHGERMASQVGAFGKPSGVKYIGAILLSGGVFGALSLQLKELAQGRDPRDMQSKAFMAAALLQGGGMGIYGDFMFGGVNRMGGGLVSTVAGPLVGKVDQLRNVTVGNVLQSATGEKTNLPAEAVRWAGNMVPGSSLWYVRAAYERIVLDQLQHLIDPEARQAFRRKMQQRKRDYGNEFWWRPGEATPWRAPDLSGSGGR